MFLPFFCSPLSFFPSLLPYFIRPVVSFTTSGPSAVLRWQLAYSVHRKYISAPPVPRSPGLRAPRPAVETLSATCLAWTSTTLLHLSAFPEANPCPVTRPSAQRHGIASFACFKRRDRIQLVQHDSGAPFAVSWQLRDPPPDHVHAQLHAKGPAVAKGFQTRGAFGWSRAVHLERCRDGNGQFHIPAHESHQLDASSA